MKKSLLLLFTTYALLSGIASSRDCTGTDLVTSFGRLPLYFIENQGQLDREVAYYVQGSDKTLYFTSKGITIAFNDDDRRWSVKLDFVNADPDAKLRGQERQQAVFSYFKGKEEHWKTNVPTFRRLVYENLWPGIDLAYSGTVDELKYELIVKPGAHPKKIELAYRGIGQLSLNESGALKVTTPAGGFEDGVPFAYQMDDEGRTEVSVRYVLEEEKAGADFPYGFEVGKYDASKPLILDPAIHIYCGYIGGIDSDTGSGIAVDDQGRIYVTGRTQSSETSFPVEVGPDLTHNGGTSWGDAYVARLSADGRDIEYCGYIGGSMGDWGSGIAVDGAGNAYVTGETQSHESTFPVKVGPDLDYNGGYNDAFVARVNAQGTDLDFCGYIGGWDMDDGTGIALDDECNVYISGVTQSDEKSFPVKIGPDLTYGGGNYHGDAFIARVNAQGTDLDYCGYIGGMSDDLGSGVAVNSDGNAYVIGRTASNESSFPVKGGPDLSHNGSGDAFVAKVNLAGSDLVYCGYIGGASEDWGFKIALDSEGNAYVTGRTQSSESSFPVKKGPDLYYDGGYYYGDGFVAKVNAAGTDLDYCGYIGGGGDDDPSGIALDSAGNAYVAGETMSTESSFPVKGGPDLTFNGGGFNGQDAFVARVNAEGTDLDFCGYIGGDGDDWAHDIAVDGKGDVYISGSTESTQSTFPVIEGPDLTYNGGSSDAYVTKITYLSLAADSNVISASTGGIVQFSLDAGTLNAGRDYLMLGTVSGTSPGIPLPGGKVTLPLNWDVFMNLVLGALNTPVFPDFMGVLDAEGYGAAKLNLPGPLPPGSVGIVMHFAYALNKPWDFASNPMPVVVVP